ncbi:succinoglycan biosynthesis protein ExoM [Herbaspirillum sp. Sphag1AN]|uniref:glycosyltransferase family 2 protein n=1 Tax=unclassified Herbaspirillum TaxID=2624150 RepID=UPI00160BAF10|nr:MULTISPECIES: glycosyltransferase family A protein [unclassified Herbaspirillum]MBB3211091.1 succinoglycan biosynthesis protein ExoM [Herbaspirillum sp. Sphag1AN]MBB3244720.1 succinoglycan biosynthesis protein ExoM [Herbaspirillum sp. Sphag64]
MSQPMDISICICTFRRPLLLDQLLHALRLQARGELRIEVIVVDNDPQASALPVLTRWQSQLPVTLRHYHQAIPNIAETRNLAVQQAQGQWVLFIDDDEAPDADWILKIVAAQERYQADVVFAPVLPRYRADTPDWIRAGDFFNRPRYLTGTVIGISDARTGNVLIRRQSLLAIPGPFDAAFGRSGAEDTMLFRDMLANGARFVWCDEATVSEEVPAERAKLSWLLRRSYRLGQTYMRSELVRLATLPRLLRATQLGLRALLQLVVAALLSLLLLPVSRIKAIRWLRTTLAQCGKLSALLGHRYHEYGH